MTVYKENDKWYCRFKIHGQQKHLLCQGARSKAQAEAIEDAEKFKLRQAQAGLVKYLKPIVFHKLLDKYLKWAEINKKSYTTDVCRVKKIKEYFPNKLITEITVGEIEQFKANLTCGETTANKYLSLLSKVFNIAISEGYMEKNLCESITYFKKQNYGTRYLTDNEEQRLMKVLPQYLKDIVEVALHTGLRKSNILELTWNQINFDLGFIEVLKNKGNKHIILPMTENIKELFKKLYNSNNKYVFTNPETGNRYYEIDRAFRKALQRANISNFRFHDLRHTVGTRLAKQGVPVNVIKEILAHSRIETTMRYIHITENSMLNALSKL